jgi:2,4-dienoyl-CoA reductase-like NADH-dependent reductase (Old Yellow Enzyme family)
VLSEGLVDYLDMSLWDVRTAPLEPTSEDDLLIDHFTRLPRGDVRLGVAGKVLSAEDARWCLGRGADFTSLGTAAILHHDLPRRVAADPDFASTPQPVTRAHLRAESVGPAFLDYLADSWDDFVSD